MKPGIIFITNIVLVFLFGSIQSFSLISFYGVKPDLLLSLLTVLMFSTKNFWQYLILVLTGIISLKYSGSITRELAIFGIIMLIAFYFKKYIAEYEFLSIFSATIILTTALYVVIDCGFIINNFYYFILELIYNVLAGIIFWLILDTAAKSNISSHKQ